MYTSCVPALLNNCHGKGPLLTLISPAKTLDYDSPLSINSWTEPQFQKHSSELISTLKPMSKARIAKLMSLSDKLATLNVERYRAYEPKFTPENSRPSIMAFKGDVYIGLQAETLSKPDLKFAQKHLRILSGLYGLLRPLDLMQPYRLEMGTDLKNKRGKNLYDFWGDTITDSINQQLAEDKTKVVVNLASKEYFSAVNASKLDGELVSPVFLDWKNGEYKIISFFAKKARGSMARYLIRERVKSLKKLQQFDADGYRFDAERSTPLSPVYLRKIAE